jgi:hypothetical protein
LVSYNPHYLNPNLNFMHFFLSDRLVVLTVTALYKPKVGPYIGSWDGPVGIATGWAAGDTFPAGARGFSILHSVQTGSGAHQAYLVDTGG